LALKELESCTIDVSPGFVGTDHAMPTTHGPGWQQKQNGCQCTSLRTVLPSNLVWAAMQLAVPAPFRMLAQLQLLDQVLHLRH
tara:strand:+ start:224 stop:472 length:249 start_codon:yes stop_codon:yes gene_type:complete